MVFKKDMKDVLIAVCLSDQFDLLYKHLHHGLLQILEVVHAYKFAKFLVPVLESLNTRKYTVKDLISFVIEIID